MKLTVLVENSAGGGFLAEHGLSYLIGIDGEQILFDSGHSDVFLRNAEKLGIDIHKKVEKVVLSHGHWDHGDGLRFIENKTLITHPDSFIKRFRKRDHSTVGLTLSKNQLKNKFNVVETREPYQISDNLCFLGEIPRDNDFESQTTPFEQKDGTDDFVFDDSALAAIINDELIIVTGCSHSGICNICEQAKLRTGISTINTVIGGFHLKHPIKQTLKTIEYFKRNKVKRILPSHCTDLPALTLFYDEFKIQQVKTGMVFRF
jgi:7,8-dihydropterin-6-yl-methyl-4-(beta-D-ribofuranosyl)aminobenzene 5'-phosphate synthase